MLNTLVLQWLNYFCCGFGRQSLSSHFVFIQSVILSETYNFTDHCYNLKSIWKVREGTLIISMPGKQGRRGREWKRKWERMCCTNEVKYWHQIHIQILIYLDQARSDEVKLLKMLAITEPWDCLLCLLLLAKNCSWIWTKVFPILVVNQISKYFNRFIENWPS